MIRFGIFGKGRLSQAVQKLQQEDQGDLELAWLVDRGDPQPGKVDVALDASLGGAVPEHIKWALQTGSNLVIGATGWDKGILTGLPSPLPIGLMVAPNFSLSVALLRHLAKLLGAYASLNEKASLGIFERHHEKKLDAPSGTAIDLAQSLIEGSERGINKAEQLLGKKMAVVQFTNWQTGRAEKGKINMASQRLGQEVGYHELRLELPDERLILVHQADDRSIFAAGALRALRWMRGRRGLFQFSAMADEIVETLLEKK